MTMAVVRPGQVHVEGVYPGEIHPCVEQAVYCDLQAFSDLARTLHLDLALATLHPLLLLDRMDHRG
jgi:hypothetical protein